MTSDSPDWKSEFLQFMAFYDSDPDTAIRELGTSREEVDAISIAVVRNLAEQLKAQGIEHFAPEHIIKIATTCYLFGWSQAEQKMVLIAQDALRDLVQYREEDEDA